MPRQKILSSQEKESLFALPESIDQMIQLYTLSEFELSLIRQHSRGASNRIGFAILICYMKFPGTILSAEQQPNQKILNYICEQLQLTPNLFTGYGEQVETRRDHILLLKKLLGFETFNISKHYRKVVQSLEGVALQSNQGIVLAKELVINLRREKLLLPPVEIIERICANAMTNADRSIYKSLTAALSEQQKQQLELLLSIRENSRLTILGWLRQSPTASNARHLLEHIERLKIISDLQLPENIEKSVHQNRLLKLSKEGCQMTAQHLKDFETTRRYATLVAIILETKSTIIDEIINLHDHIMGKLFSRAKNQHQQRFHKSGKEINNKVILYWRIGEVLLEAKLTGEDPFSAIESIISWEEFSQSIAEAQRLTQSESFDYIQLIGDSYSQIRRYAPALLEILQFKTTPALKEILDAVEILKGLNADNIRKVPSDALTGFIRKRWENLIFKEDGLDRRFYELCVFSELKNALRSGDIWVRGSRQFKDFDSYLLNQDAFTKLKEAHTIPLAITKDADQYINERFSLLHRQLKIVNELATDNELSEVAISENGLKISPLTNSVPKEAEVLTQQVYSLLPHIKITELLLEVDSWVELTNHFTHLKSGDVVRDKTLLLTAILADGVNLGLSKMAEVCPGITYAKLSWLQAWYIRDETYSIATAHLVNALHEHPFATYWGDGTTSSSDGQRFRSSSHAEKMGRVNPKYGSEPGVQFYTHVSDQYSPFHTKVINVGVRDATYVLDGLLYHESELKIEEHYTDTSGFSDHVFALMHLLGFRFAPRIRDLADKKLYIPPAPNSYTALEALIGGSINAKQIKANWDDILRLATSIQQGVVTASLIVKKIGSYPRQNGLAIALRELGRIERTLFTLNWYMDPQLRDVLR